jgi:hypothetical protein
MDMLDKVIQRCRLALHEGGRLAAVKRRHEKERQAEANVLLQQIEDRIAFHVPLRDRRPSESSVDYERHVAGVKMRRHQLMLMAVSAMQPNDDLWGDDAPDSFTRGDL